ncbi:cellulose biosynthesis cyclic di-GMP-binding regulatory protein BcsB [Bosea sp. NBC_00550]|uniref:cellulose biosynthesis cyclic di-GMP-binding regulatory protein BcsB n=1 Tax=Bosea sp. NBC_00550 TaxID=2969621 RepID=UPI00222F3316|nr:cellulose biosynthesis cyclic di-GMP-binding regulatory protein BcsB [Bosea sp. NBC_00550]UZF90389.1 cellulose biosynthesis cyclic di-GMP-binding regulatory protein BcsB [Bosea sp. NBC_00550]
MKRFGIPLLAAAIAPLALGLIPHLSAQEAPSPAPAPAPFMIAPPSQQPAAPPPAAPAPAPSREAAPPPAPAFAFKPLLPASRVTLEGESDTRSWAFYLSQDEAGTDLSLDVAFQNALVVMPEVSRLAVRLNGERIIEVPIASSDRLKHSSTAVRKGLLRPGQNTISFEVLQRHRTDCTVASTYELWTRIDGAGTRLTFKGPNAQQFRLRGIDDLPAIGADEGGQTTIVIVAPGASRAISANSIFAVAQALALRGRYGQVAVKVSEQMPDRVRPGTLTVALGTNEEIRALLGALPAEAGGRSFLGFVPSPKKGADMLLVTGESWPDLDAIVGKILTAPVSRPANINRKTMDTASWHVPDAPFISDRQVVRFSELGIATQESSGRRMRVRAVVAMPGDFYANAYGEATLYLDGAYSNEVLPGDSHIEIFVNGNVAATVPLNAATGGLFQQFPITVPLRHFRPGVNEVWFETVTVTKSDLACGPGATLPGKSRFALFDTTALAIPDFAKIGVSPNLAAVAGTGFPYSVASRVALIMGRQDPANLSAATTLLAHIAQRASRPLAVDVLAGTAAVGDRPVLIVGAAGQLPAGLLPRVGIADNVRATWPLRADAVVVTPDAEGAAVFDAVINRLQGRQATPEASGGAAPTTEGVRERWRGSLGGPLARYFIAFDQWLQRTFDLSFAQLRTPSRAPTLYEPAEGTDLIAVQAADPDTRQVWTAFIARREEALESTVDRIVSPGNWAGMAGKITAFRGAQEAHIISADSTSFVMTRPFSLANMRLVFANWMSSNIGIYALALLTACIGLGIGTSLMLGRLGRRS